MKVLFIMRHAGYVRLFESTLRMLCDRGHDVHLAFQRKVRYEQLDPTDIAGQLAAEYPAFSHGRVHVRSDSYGLLGRDLRLGLDYLRYLGREYDDAPKLRERARRDVPRDLLERASGGWTATPAGRWMLARSLRTLDLAIPRDPETDTYIAGVRPDVLAVTPLIEPGAPQVEFVRSARAHGIPVVHCVASWDNLTNKGLIHGPVDLVTVWNEAMKREAVELHGIPAGRVAVTGAAAFDHWFDWRQSTTREAFCERVGLPADRPYLLYVGSSKFVAPEEVPFVLEWVRRIRQCGSADVRDAGVLIRPHPQNAGQWQDVDVRPLGAAAVWPRGGAAPVDAGSRSEYFDSIFHAAAVVGVNTTAEIESAIVGRPIFTVLAPEFRETQEGTLHFRHLGEAGGGAVTAAATFEEHLAQVGAALADPSAAAARCRRFVETFVRPHGLQVPATPRLVDALEQVARTGRPRARAPLWAPLLGPYLARRTAQLEREVEALAEAKTVRIREAKRRAQEARARAARSRPQSRARLRKESAAALGTDAPLLETVAQAFTALGYADRKKFLGAVVESIPHRSLIELLAYAVDKPGKLDYEHADILMRVLTDAEEWRLRACSKEPFTIDWIHQRIGPGDVLYDIGANVGAYSLVAAKKPGGGARVFSFEPSYFTVASLTANVILNNLTEQVTPIPVALSGATELTVFSLGSLEPGSARHALGRVDAGDGRAVFPQPVMKFRLDDLIEWLHLPLPHHIKLDVDGGELEVLEGAARTLASPSLRTVLIEVSTSLSDAVIRALGTHGLRLDSKISVKNKAGEYAVWYGVFVRGASGPVNLRDAPPR